MDKETTVELQAPPLPYYLGAGRSDYRTGDQHPHRKNLGIYDLLIVAKGALYIGENGREWRVADGETLLLLPDGEHYPVKPCDRETIFYWIHFEHEHKAGDALADDPESRAAYSRPFVNPYALRIPKHSRLSNPRAALGLIVQLLELPVGNSFWEEQRLLADLLAMLTKRDAGDAGSPVARLAESAASYLRQNYRADLTNETLAEALHFHPNYIVRSMKAKYGCTPMHYLHDFRMDQAKRLLVTTNWPVARIAEEVGFRYAPYFTACFKRSVGMNPLSFRKQYVR